MFCEGSAISSAQSALETSHRSQNLSCILKHTYSLWTRLLVGPLGRARPTPQGDRRGGLSGPLSFVFCFFSFLSFFFPFFFSRRRARVREVPCGALRCVAVPAGRTHHQPNLPPHTISRDAGKPIQPLYYLPSATSNQSAAIFVFPCRSTPLHQLCLLLWQCFCG